MAADKIWVISFTIRAPNPREEAECAPDSKGEIPVASGDRTPVILANQYTDLDYSGRVLIYSVKYLFWEVYII